MKVTFTAVMMTLIGVIVTVAILAGVLAALHLIAHHWLGALCWGVAAALIARTAMGIAKAWRTHV